MDKLSKRQSATIMADGCGSSCGCSCKNSSHFSLRDGSGRHFTNSLYLLVAALIFLSGGILPIPVVDGLECYECLSLSCPSLAVCESIKRTMLEVFVPKGHIIHFNPLDPCPEGEDPDHSNSTKWAELSKECQRSDSVCIVSPIEIVSIIDGSKSGKKLDRESSLTTHGFLRGCASRRKLQENDPTIRVHVNLLQSSSPTSGRNSTTESSSSGHTSGSRFGQSSQDLEMELDLSKLKFDDGFEIQRVHSHEFFLDQGTSNATKCLEDRCNTKVRMRSGGVRNGGSWVMGAVLLGLGGSLFRSLWGCGLWL